MHYTVEVASAEAHLFKVTLDIANPDPEGQVLSLPTWIPGSYLVRDFSKHVVSIRASCNGSAIALTKLDKSRWQAEPCAGGLRVEYQVYAWDLSVRSAHLDTTHAYFNGTSLFLAAEGAEEQPCTVELVKPPFEYADHWRVATSLGRDGAELYGFGCYRAENYQDLIDHPVEIGNFTLATFLVAGVPHDIVLTGRHRADMDRLCVDLRKICERQVALFGELPEIERYLFLVMVVGDGYGGLEHRSSTSLLCSRGDLPLAGRPEISDGYRTFLGLCSHEYFHTWNVKRIKPEVFTPYRLEQESYTRQLWAFEGITSYYDDLMLPRSGVLSAEQYLELLGQTITRVWRAPGRFVQSVADSSFDAWTKFYKQDENAANSIVSYYTKGSLIALALDCRIRKASGGERSLDDVMRLLWQRYGKPGIGVPEGAIEALASEVAGEDLAPLFDAVLYGTEDPELKSVFEWLGVEFCLRPAESFKDVGGKPASKPGQAVMPALGAKVEPDQGMPKLVALINGGSAVTAGLAAGDVLLAFDGLKVTSTNLESLLAGYDVGDVVEVHAFRRDELMCFRMTLQAAKWDTAVLTLMAGVGSEILARRADWLGASGV